MLTEKFWERYFKVYDTLNTLIPYQELMEKLKNELDLKQDDIVLDVGSGTGNLMMVIKNKCKKCIGLDFSPAGVKVHKEKDPNVEVILHDITVNFPFQNNYFSKIVSNNVIYSLNEKQQGETLNEIYRVLKPGGKLVVSNVKKKFSPIKIYFDHTNKNMKQVGILNTIIFFFKMFLPILKMFYYNIRIKKSGLSKQYNFFKLGEQKNLLEKVGFINVSSDDFVYSNQAIINTCYKP